MVERTFGILFQQFHILTVGARAWSCEECVSIITCCTILHNMVVEKRRDVTYTRNGFGGRHLNADETAELPDGFVINSRVYILGENLPPAAEDIEDRSLHSELNAALVEHIWEKIGSGLALDDD